MARHSFRNNVFKRLNAIWPTLLLFIFVIAATPARARDQMNVVYASISGLFLGCWNAQEAGYFNRENIDVNLVYMQSATTAMQSLLSGDASIILAGGEPVLKTNVAGAFGSVFGCSTGLTG